MLLNAFFAFMSLKGKHQFFLVYPGPDLEDNNGEQNEDPIIQREIVSDLLHHLNTQNPMGSDGIHPEVLWKCSTSHFPLLISIPGLSGKSQLTGGYKM